MSRSFIKLQARTAQALEGRRESGATAVEYGLLVALIAAVIIVAVTAIGTNLSAVFNGVAGLLHMPAAE